MTKALSILICAVLFMFVVASSLASFADRAAQPGQPVKVAAIAIGYGGDYTEKLNLALEHLEVAGRHGADIACLPEEFTGTEAEPVPGRTAGTVAALAQKHRMYVVCPIRERGADGRRYNTAVLLDRAGRVAGVYRKVFTFWGEGNSPSPDGVKTFDADFGRLALLTCFDANFDEVWQEAERKDAEIVFWPSAYPGGRVLNGYALIHNYCIVAVGRGNLIDGLGRTIEPAETPLPRQFIATVDLDRTVVHKNFTADKVARLLQEHAGEVELEPGVGDAENWYVLRAMRPGVRVRDLCRHYRIETLREYRHRGRLEINERRKTGREV